MIVNYRASEKEELESFIDRVSENILQTNLSLFIGAGSSMQYNFMSWNELMKDIYSKCDNWNNTEKAQFAELKGINVKGKICKKILSKHVVIENEDTYLNHLLNFDYKSFWTTNYDEIIERVLTLKSKKYISIFKYSDFKKLSFPGSNFLFKINGSCSDQNTIVATKNDFIDYKTSHEAYLILLKRELLCHNFLFLGCSFDDDILRMCIKDILNCIDNSNDNYSTEHFAIIVESNQEKLEYISEDLRRHYNINCLTIEKPSVAYNIAYGISSNVKYHSIFVSGAKAFKRHSAEEEKGKYICKELVKSFMNNEDYKFKFISGMGMSIGNFVCGSIKQMCNNKNVNRYLQMEPFPFTNQEDRKKHRHDIISKAGIFIFIYGDYDGKPESIHKSGMWQEYLEAKKDKRNIIISLPCGKESISEYIFSVELNDKTSFIYKCQDLLKQFKHTEPDSQFFKQLTEAVIFSSKNEMEKILNEITEKINN